MFTVDRKTKGEENKVNAVKCSDAVNWFVFLLELTTLMAAICSRDNQVLE